MADEQWSPRAPGSSEAEHDLDDMTIPRSKLPRAGSVFHLRVDDGTKHAVRGRTFIGRAPEPQPASLGGALIPVPDTSMSVSKTHAMFDVVDGELRISDVGSTNGTVVVTASGDSPVPVGTWRVLSIGDRVRLGDRWVDVVAGDNAGPGRVAVPPSTAVGPPDGLISGVPPHPGGPIGGPAPLHGAAQPPPPIGVAPVAVDGAVGVPPPVGQVGGQAAGPTGGPAGSSLTTRRRRGCSNCKTKLGPDVTFCTECGTPVEQNSTGGPPWKLIGAVVGAVAFVAAVVVVATVIRQDGQSTAGAGSERPALSTDPSSRAVFDIETTSAPWVLGAPDSMMLTWADFDRDETVLAKANGDGEVSWEVGLDGERQRLQLIDGVALVGLWNDGSEIVALDASTGDELWSEDIDDQSWWAGPEGVYLADDDTIELFDHRTGDSLARARVGGDRYAIGDLIRLGVVISWDREDEEVQILSSTLEDVTEVLDVGRADDVSYADGTIVAVDGDSLVGYDHDGEERFDARTSIDEISSVLPLRDGRWAVSGNEEVEVIEIDGDAAESLWDAGGYLEDAFVSNGVTIVVVGGDDRAFHDAGTGDVLADIDDIGFFQIGRNGFVHREDGRATAVELPSGDELWSERLSDDEHLDLLDDGYAVVEFDEDEATIEVFG